jgi:hypothetical protein
VTCGWSGLLQKRLESVELDGVLAMGPEQRFAEGYGGRLLCPLDIVVIAAKSVFTPGRCATARKKAGCSIPTAAACGPG